MNVSSAIRCGAFRLLLMTAIALNASSLSATTDACWLESDTLKLRKLVVVPQGEQEKFIAYLRQEVAGDLSRSEVGSGRDLSLIFQNVESGILAITIEYSKRDRVFSAKVEACDFQKD